MKTVLVYDVQQDKTLSMNSRLADNLCAKYFTRFKYVFVSQGVPARDIPSTLNSGKENNTMPQLPQETKKFANGAHTVVAFEVKTTTGQFGPQEEITCLKEGTEDMTRIWLSHSGRKKILQAHDAGLVDIDPDTDAWSVIIGARVQILVAGGKVVGLAKAPKPEAG